MTDDKPEKPTPDKDDLTAQVKAQAKRVDNTMKELSGIAEASLKKNDAAMINKTGDVPPRWVTLRDVEDASDWWSEYAHRVGVNPRAVKANAEAKGSNIETMMGTYIYEYLEALGAETAAAKRDEIRLVNMRMQLVNLQEAVLAALNIGKTRDSDEKPPADKPAVFSMLKRLQDTYTRLANELRAVPGPAVKIGHLVTDLVRYKSQMGRMLVKLIGEDPEGPWRSLASHFLNPQDDATCSYTPFEDSLLRKRKPEKFKGQAGEWDFVQYKKDEKGQLIPKPNTHLVVTDASGKETEYAYGDSAAAWKQFEESTHTEVGIRIEGGFVRVSDDYDAADWRKHTRIQMDNLADACEAMAEIISEEMDRRGADKGAGETEGNETSPITYEIKPTLSADAMLSRIERLWAWGRIHGRSEEQLQSMADAITRANEAAKEHNERVKAEVRATHRAEKANVSGTYSIPKQPSEFASGKPKREPPAIQKKAAWLPYVSALVLMVALIVGMLLANTPWVRYPCGFAAIALLTLGAYLRIRAYGVGGNFDQKMQNSTVTLWIYLVLVLIILGLLFGWDTIRKIKEWIS